MHILCIPTIGVLMKKFILILCLSFCLIGCSREQTIIGTYQGNGFYFTMENGDLYEYSGALTKVEGGIINSVNRTNAQSLQTSTQTAVSVMSSSGKIIFRHEPNQFIEASVINSELTKVTFVNASGQLYEYNRNTNITKDMGVTIYPVPKQMVLDKTNRVVFYHDKTNVYSLDLQTLERTLLTKIMVPIQSIAYNPKTSDVYFSTSTDGKIYKVNQHASYAQLVHEPISARGATVAVDSMGDFLYFSKSNGQDIQIKSINLSTKEIDSVVTLYKLNYINNLISKD